jgi:TfoX/Sxy family transcriptional regulator of competence genes
MRAVAYDEGVAERIRDVLADDPDVTERQMFGGIAFLCAGNMSVGIVGEDLMVRVGKEAFTDALARPFAREMDFTGRPSKGMVYVAPEGIAEDDDLRAWIARGTTYARSLPPK